MTNNCARSPDSNGFIDADPQGSSSGVAGGHDVEAIGVKLDTRDVFDSVIVYVIVYANSWGSAWGIPGGLACGRGPTSSSTASI
jgi:hypothetical protein